MKTGRALPFTSIILWADQPIKKVSKRGAAGRGPAFWSGSGPGWPWPALAGHGQPGLVMVSQGWSWPATYTHPGASWGHPGQKTGGIRGHPGASGGIRSVLGRCRPQKHMGIPTKVPAEPGASSGRAGLLYNIKKGKLRFRHGFGGCGGRCNGRAILEFYEGGSRIL